MPNASYHGLLVLDKPSGMTSRAAVDRALGWFPKGTKVGHSGTLDPLATGVLVLCVGTATRLIEFVQDMSKTYRAGILLGSRSDTDDADGNVTPALDAQPPTREKLVACLQEFVGEIEQVPPDFSAARVTGRRAYNLARQGLEVTLAPRRVHVYGIDLLGYEYPHAELEVRCGKGTYIRSLARDLGDRLGCGALVETLRRTRVGPFDVKDAVSLEADVQTARDRLLPISSAVTELQAVRLDAGVISDLRHGKAVSCATAVGAEMIAVLDAAGNLVAIVRYDPSSGLLRPSKVFHA